MRKKLSSWPMAMAILCCYSAIEAPVLYLFGDMSSWFAIASNLIVSAILMTLVLSCSKNHELNDIKKKNKSHDYQSWFLIFCSLPFGIVGPKFLIFFKLLRFAGLLKAHQELNASTEIPRFKKISLILMGALTGVHLVACMWLLVEPSNGLTASQAYIKALYWAVTTLTTTGYGDITPTTEIGRLFTIGVMLSGFSAFGIIVGNVSNQIMARNRHQEANREKMEDLAHFMQHYEVPRALRTQVFNFNSHRLNKRLSENDSKIIADLPHGLQNELQIYIRMKLIDGLPIFHGLSHECLKKVAQHLESISFATGNYMIKKGETGEEMFIVDQGEVEVVNDHGLTVAIIKHGQCVGEIALLTKALRTANVIARSYCDVYRLKQDDFNVICKEFPELDENFRKIMVRRTQDKAA